MAQPVQEAPYPVRLEVDYPERLSRWKALVRLPLSLPLLIFAYLLAGGVVAAIWAAILLRGRIPHWLFDFQVAFNRWWIRAAAYLLLLTDEYPPFEGTHPIRYDVDYPERVSRWRLVVWKFITSIAHGIVLAVLFLGVIAAVVIAWFAILLTGRFPSGLHGYVAGVARWSSRVGAYVNSLTDEFPPFSLSQDAGPGAKRLLVISAAVGVLVTAGVIAIPINGLFIDEESRLTVSYGRLRLDELPGADTLLVADGVTVELAGAQDPADDLIPIMRPLQGHRFIAFSLFIANAGGAGIRIKRSDFWLRDSDGGRTPILVLADGRRLPAEVPVGGGAEAVAIFEVPDGADPAELHYRTFFQLFIYEFR